MTTLERVTEMLAEHLCLEADNITPHDAMNDLGADSLDLIEIEMAVEELFGFDVNDGQMGLQTRVEEIVSYIDAHANR